MKIEHVAIYVKDLERSRCFLKNTLALFRLANIAIGIRIFVPISLRLRMAHG